MIDPRSGKISGELPCGYLDSEGKVHSSFIVGEMTGEEEDLLAGQGNVLSRLNKVILNCLDQLGELVERPKISQAVGKLTAVDRMYLLIAIRRASLGNEFNMEFTCSSCGHKSKASLNLAGLEVTKMEDPTIRSFESNLVSGKVVHWKVMDGRDEDWLQTMQKKGRDILTMAMLARVTKIDDKEVDRSNVQRASEILKRLTLRERNEIRSLFRGKEGSIDTQVEYECPACSAESNYDLDVGQPSFFFPVEIE